MIDNRKEFTMTRASIITGKAAKEIQTKIADSDKNKINNFCYTCGKLKSKCTCPSINTEEAS